MKKYIIKDNLGNKKTVYADNLRHALTFVDETYNPEYSIQQFKSYVSNIIKDLYGIEYNSNKVRAISELDSYVSQVIDDFKADIKNSNLDKRKTVQYYMQYVNALYKELTNVKNVQNIDGQSLKKIDDIHAKMARSIHDSKVKDDVNRPKTFKFFINNRAVSEDEYTKSFIKEAAREHQSATTAKRVINEDKESAKISGKSVFMCESGSKFSIIYDSKVKDEANLPTTIQALVNDEEAAIKAYEVAIKNLEGKIDETQMQVLINIMKDERRHVENLYAILNGQVTEKNLEDSIKDAFIVKADNEYIMEGDRPEMTSFKKHAKVFSSKQEAIDYARKYFRLRPIDIEIIEE